MNNNDLEEKIIKVAKENFIEKGFDGASMSDIAVKVGINRPTLHYYYRTKEKMFQAVVLSIIQTFIPRIQDVIVNDEVPFPDKISKTIDIYIDVAKENPNLPLFVVREINRNAIDFVDAVRTIYLKEFLDPIGKFLLFEMEKGKIKKVPLWIIFNTFYGLLIFPFLSRNLMLMESGDTLESQIEAWRPYFIDQMVHLLCND